MGWPFVTVDSSTWVGRAPRSMPRSDTKWVNEPLSTSMVFFGMIGSRAGVRVWYYNSGRLSLR
eukprot:202065-Chlamydomonas_euryale.AAC.1